MIPEGERDDEDDLALEWWDGGHVFSIAPPQDAIVDREVDVDDTFNVQLLEVCAVARSCSEQVATEVFGGHPLLAGAATSSSSEQHVAGNSSEQPLGASTAARSRSGRRITFDGIHFTKHEEDPNYLAPKPPPPMRQLTLHDESLAPVHVVEPVVQETHVDSQPSQSSTVPAVRSKEAPCRCAPHESAWVPAEHESAGGTGRVFTEGRRRVFDEGMWSVFTRDVGSLVASQALADVCSAVPRSFAFGVFPLWLSSVFSCVCRVLTRHVVFFLFTFFCARRTGQCATV